MHTGPVTRCLAAFLLIPLLFQPGLDPTVNSLILDTLEELARTQKISGRWRAPRKTPDGLSDTGLTALGILSLAGAGHTHNRGKFRNTMAKALGHLKKRVDEDGRVKGRFVNQALVTHALAELLAVSQDEELKGIAGSAAEGLLRRQNEDGSFGDPAHGGIYPTVLAIMAMKAMRTADLKVAPSQFQSARDYLRRQLEHVTFVPKGKTAPLESRGAISAVYLGGLLSGARMSEAFQTVLADRIAKGEYPSRNAREAYIVMATVFQIQGEAWTKYREGQDGWISAGKRSRDLPGRLFETLALEIRKRWERAN